MSTLSAQAIADATPASRDRYVDFLRAVAIGAVVLGHWLVADVTMHDGEFGGQNALGSVALLRALTLLFQVMPLFFVVGGFANAASLAAASRRGDDDATWLRGRLLRIARPAGAFVTIWTALVVVLGIAGQSEFASAAGRVVVFPLWFLPVYLAVTTAAPAMLALHRRWGGRVILALAAAVATADLAGFGLVNLLFVWLAFQQLGFWWSDHPDPPAPWRWLVVGALVLAGLTTLGPYPLDMVSAPGHGASNTAPPTLALLVFGMTQFAAALCLRRPLTRWLQRPRPWAAVVAVNVRAMTLYLWHLTAVVGTALVLLPVGLPQPSPGTADWWVLRPAWLAIDVVFLALLVRAFGRFETGASPGSTTPLPVAVATGALIGAFFFLTTEGFWVSGGPNWPTLALLAVAAVSCGSGGRGRAGS